MDSTIKQKLKNIILLAMDFDGVHTDGFVYVSQNGMEAVRCSRRDSLGLNMLKQIGVKLFVISKEPNPVVTSRCKKLDIECYQNVSDSLGKQKLLISLMEREKVLRSEVVFIGDDINDIDAIKYAGVGVTVADGHVEIQKHADIVLTRKGGDHAIRELCELILEAKGLHLDAR